MESANDHNMNNPAGKMMTAEDKMVNMNTMMVEHLGQSDVEIPSKVNTGGKCSLF